MDRPSHAAPLPGEPDAIAVPPAVLDLLGTLWAAGHDAFVVGGSVRDALLGRPAADWDLATSARPEQIVEAFPGSVYENRFGTVAVRRDDDVFEITTFRSDHDYADFRRPHRVEFGDDIEPDLARRDFTVNAIAWGRTGDRGAAKADGSGKPAIVDPFDGRADLATRTLRAVGDPIRRFDEDALRMLRAVRLATVLDFTIEPATLEAIAARAELARHLSGERVAAEMARLLAAPAPSTGLRLMETSGLLRELLPELAAERGVAQNKVPGDDLWDHTLRSVDAAAADRPIVRWAALLHDIGKPATAADGHFYGHDAVGAEMAEAILGRLRLPRAVIDRVVQLIRQHMFMYDSGWSDAAVRRFIGKVGLPALDELLDLRAADNVGSGRPADAGGLGELRRRIDEQLAAEVALDRADLQVDGGDLITELGLSPGPLIGRLLDDLLERVIADPALNDRPTLLLLAQGALEEDR
ncbi:MAG TPA: HD domain-containing protein [Candidatus Limnocylindrales bacterium]|nr:HD domain-containing protein [Candidatus Limnocylindrales bacterium]